FADDDEAPAANRRELEEPHPRIAPGDPRDVESSVRDRVRSTLVNRGPGTLIGPRPRQRSETFRRRTEVQAGRVELNEVVFECRAPDLESHPNGADARTEPLLDARERRHARGEVGAARDPAPRDGDSVEPSKRRARRTGQRLRRVEWRETRARPRPGVPGTKGQLDQRAWGQRWD